MHLLRAMKVAWPGDVVQEMSAEGDPKSNGDASSSVYVIKGHDRWIKVAVELASAVAHNLLTCVVPYATSVHRRFSVGQDGKRAFARICEDGQVLLGTAR